MLTFNHFNFNVLDMQRSLAFYKEALGLTPLREKRAADGSYWIVFLQDEAGSPFALELTELRDRREGKAACENCEYKIRDGEEYPCVCCKHNFTDKYRPKKTTSAENDWYDIPAEEMTKEQAQKAVKELRKALLEARTEAKHG